MYWDGVGIGTGVMKIGWGWEKLVGMGWVWGEQVVPVQLSNAYASRGKKH